MFSYMNIKNSKEATGCAFYILALGNMKPSAVEF